MKIGYLLLLLPWVKPAWADEAFIMSLPECQARLELRSAEPRLLTVGSDCVLSMVSLIRLLQEGLPVFLSADSAAISSVSLGRLMNYPQWSRALARAAGDSPAWDRHRGRPAKRQQNANRIVMELLNRSAYLNDLQAVFSRYGFTACVAGVEKVLVFRAGDIFRNDLPDSLKLAAGDLLPSDAQVWLTLRPAEDETPGLSSRSACRLSGLQPAP